MTYHQRHSPHPDLPRFEDLERPAPASDVEDAGARRARQLAMLRRLAEMAMELCEDAFARAKAQGAAEAGGAGEAAPGAAARGRWDGEAGAGAEADAGAEAASADRVEAQIDALKRAVDAAAGGVAGGGIPTRADPSLVFARLSRVVFRALALERQIVEDEAAEAEDTVDPTYDPEMTPERKARIMARWQLLLSRKNAIVRVVKAAIAAEHPWEDSEECGRQLNDKLLEFERFQVLNSTIWDNVLRHAEPLGLHPRREDWAHESWAEAEKDGELEWDHNPYRGPGP